MLKKISIFILMLITLSSCNSIDQKITYKGSLYESNIIAFISDFNMAIEKDKIYITYPRYNCLKVKYNQKEFDNSSLKNECTVLNNFLKDNNINVPRKICTDTYISHKYKNGFSLKLDNIKTPCFSFSKNLKGITFKGEDEIIEILQFYSEYGLFQAEVNKKIN